MGYIKYIEESKQKVYNHSVATRILDLVDKLRLNSNDNDQRRWVWELIQNAKDVAYDNQPVAVGMCLADNGEESLTFKHNGKPFSIDNITFLIEQVSTKDRNDTGKNRNKPTGKFGTGFLTTHLLSETVELNSVVKETNLPHKKFSLVLDRSGTELDEIIRSVNRSLEMLKELDGYDALSTYDPKDFNTYFKYLLDKEGIDTAKKGLKDLDLCVAYTLAFVPNISSVSVNDETSYKIRPEVSVEQGGLEIHTIEKKVGDAAPEEIHIAMLSTDSASIAVEIRYENNQVYVVEPDKSLPRLFCDFPLIGSEDFNFPVVINSSFFNPTEPRDGIYITDRSDEKITENKRLMIEARDLYIKLLKLASSQNWRNLWVLANIGLPAAKGWISKQWFSTEILNPIRDQILKTPLIDTVLYGRIPIECGGYNGLPDGAVVDFPKNSNKELLPKMWHLCNIPFYVLPVESDFLHWAEIIWDSKYFVELQSITRLIEVKGDIKQLSLSLQKDMPGTKKWLNDFYSFLVEEGVFIKDIANRSIYLNQNGVFKRKVDLLFEREEIPEILKDIASELGADFRDKLLDVMYDIDLPQNAFCDISLIAGEITKLIRPRLAEIQRSQETKSIFKKLYLWFNQNSKQADEAFDFLYKNKHKLLDDEDIVTSLEKAEVFDSLLALDATLSAERILELLELEELSKGFSTDKDYTPSEEQKRINFMNGWKGEAFVYKTLLAKGFDISWPNKSQIETGNQIVDFEDELHFINDQMEKYDLRVTLPNGHISYIQVKSTTTDISRADEIAMPISVREWNFINEKDEEDAYYLARVFNVTSSPEVYFMKIENIKTI